MCLEKCYVSCTQVTRIFEMYKYYENKPEAKILKNFVFKICNISVLVAKCDGCAGRISARGLDVAGRAQQGSHTEKGPRANISQVRFRESMVNTIFITKPKMLRKAATNTNRRKQKSQTSAQL